ncbi:hypothetical protein ElyMa_006544800 [Elysia marginata]|uniref:Uncharacterized protein n=1 Tax=Elysia marginata TaxID=1093978 RepID=A0AAV4I851_9GAST|nr:hypothetical protein ElyMa_006544800 [Elysia marginata]
MVRSSRRMPNLTISVIFIVLLVSMATLSDAQLSGGGALRPSFESTHHLEKRASHHENVPLVPSVARRTRIALDNAP